DEGSQEGGAGTRAAVRVSTCHTEGRQDALSRERARCTDINVVRVYSCQQRVGCGPDAHREFSEGNAAVLKPRRIIKRNWNERVSRLGAPDAKLHQGEVLGWKRC